MNYIADIIQNPNKLPGVAVMFKSKQGYGKDFFLDIISRLIGNNYLFRTAEPEQIFGNFNSTIKDKIIIQLNELEGKDGFSNKEKLKNLITEEYTNINEKGIKQYKQNNFSRIFIMSNNLKPLDIPFDDRRFVIFKAHNKKPNKEYFTNLSKVIENDMNVKILYEYFKNFKITLDLRNNRPITQAYNEMKDSCVNPIYSFINELFGLNRIEEYFDNEDFIIHKKTQNTLIKSNTFYQAFKNYLQAEDLSYMKINFKLIKLLLKEININKKQIFVNKQNNDYYVFDPKEIIEQLKQFNFDNDILVLDDDEFSYGFGN